MFVFEMDKFLDMRTVRISDEHYERLKQLAVIKITESQTLYTIQDTLAEILEKALPEMKVNLDRNDNESS